MTAYNNNSYGKKNGIPFMVKIGSKITDLKYKNRLNIDK